MMTVEKAFERITWRLKDKMYDKDIEALKVIAEHIKKVDAERTKNNYLFAKMVVNYIHDKAKLKSWHMTEILRNVEIICQSSLRNLIDSFKLEVPYFKFEQIVHTGTEGLDPLKDFGKIKNIRLANMEKNKKALVDALKYDWSTEEAESFMEHQISKLVKNYHDHA